MASPEKTKVYRLRHLPGHVDRQSAAELFADCIGIPSHHIRISSLAYAIDQWTRSPTKTATLTLEGCIPSVDLSSRNGERTFNVGGLSKPLILDHNFRGLTPLNEVDPGSHQYDCIVISGLASHPFGSWQPHGGNKSFMWIRDELPQYLPTVRFVIYGYDTVLHPSNSFQTIPDLANSLINVLKADGWTSPTAKPLIFLAHSMGGVLLKQALLMLVGSGQKETFIASLVRGAIFFGVPSRGMAMNDVLTMLGDQLNKEALVKEISKDSDYLPQLEKQFAGISFVRTIKLFWAYETKTTRTLMTIGGNFSRSGPDIILVTRESATGDRYLEEPSMTIQIDENHSNMVKFFNGDHRIRVIASKLGEVCGVDQVAPPPAVEVESTTVHDGKDSQQSGPGDQRSTDTLIGLQLSVPDPLVWDDERILNSLRAPERDSRIEQIDPHSSHTFHWVFDKPSIGLSRWLLRGEGIFWISGKPGSGKSTLMKFVHRDPRTLELLHSHRWKSGTRQITASFFFHYRGSAIQKSFEGLLRGIISQILEAQPELLTVIRSAFCGIYDKRVATQRLGSLQSDIHRLMKFCQIQEDADLHREIEAMVESQNGLLSLQNSIGTSFDALSGDVEGPHDVEMELLRRRDDLLATNTKLDKNLFLDCKFRRLCPTNRQFVLIVESWLETLDLNSRLRQLLMSRGVEVVDEPISNQQAPKVQNIRGQDKKPTIKFVEPFERNLEVLLKRHEARNHIRIAIQNEEWPRQQLEEVLRRLCAQELFDLDLCLLLDALDEYDGRPEFISGFLKDLAQETTFPRTRIRILFSSRPWSVFREEFSTCPSFEIHKHTQDDIRNYCITSIHNNVRMPKYLRPLVEEIVARSRGVFLWVKLVLHDLSRVVADHSHGVHDIQERLHKTLDSLPDQLDEYYATIIERVSPGFRWSTYVVLESLARSDRLLSAMELVEIIENSMTRTCPDFKQLRQRQKVDSNMVDELIRVVSGGLVDIGPLHVQLMHQTVKEFIEAPQFRHMVLGLRRAEITEENGHSFLSKYLFLNLNHYLDDQLSFHAREAERTTGLSQYEFFSSAQPEYFNCRSRTALAGTGNTFISSPLMLAAFAGLQLFLEDAHKVDDEFVEKSSDPILSSLFDGMQNGLLPADAIKTAESLLSKGLVVERDKTVLSEIMSRIWLTNNPQTWRDRPDQDYINLATLLVDHLKDVNFSIAWRARKDGLETITDVSGSILHLSPPTIAERLFVHGADPNVADSSGCSPLDYILLDESAHCRSAEYLHRISLLLIKHGGKLRKTRRNEWDAFIQHLQYHALDTTAFIDYDFPLWYRNLSNQRGQSGAQEARGSSSRPELVASSTRIEPRNRSRSRLRYRTDLVVYIPQGPRPSVDRARRC